MRLCEFQVVKNIDPKKVPKMDDSSLRVLEFGNIDNESFYDLKQSK